MSVGLYRSAVAMVANQRHVEKIAANLSNIGTTGFKRAAHAIHAFDVQRRDGPVRGISTTTQVDFSQGDLARTGRAYDLGLYGDGFFAVETPHGEAYTRDGSFHLTPEGLLVTEEGYSIAWERFSVPINPTGLPVQVDGEGAVRQGTLEIGVIRVANFEDPQRLTQDSRGFYVAPADLARATVTGVVHQGTLEQSNATGMNELIELVAVQRSFETAARVMSSIEESTRRLTRPF